MSLIDFMLKLDRNSLDLKKQGTLLGHLDLELRPPTKVLSAVFAVVTHRICTVQLN